MNSTLHLVVLKPNQSKPSEREMPETSKLQVLPILLGALKLILPP